MGFGTDAENNFYKFEKDNCAGKYKIAETDDKISMEIEPILKKL